MIARPFLGIDVRNNISVARAHDCYSPMTDYLNTAQVSLGGQRGQSAGGVAVVGDY
jgi:hypothetical protein